MQYRAQIRAACKWFLRVHSPQDIEQFKAEIEKRQLKDLPVAADSAKEQQQSAGDDGADS